MNNIDKIILRGRIIVFYGAILLFFFMFMVFNYLKIDNIISLLLSLLICICYYFISSTNWLLKNILKVENGHELIEQALFYLIISKNKFENINLFLFTKQSKQKWIEIECILKTQNKNYFENYKYEDCLTIKSNKKYFNILYYLFIAISILFFIYAAYQIKFEYALFGVFFLLFGFFFQRIKKDNDIKIVLDKSGMKIDNNAIMNWSKITNEKLIFSANGVLLNLKYENQNITLKIEQYDINPFQIMNYIQHFKKYVC
ncbi:hypothetical protein M9Q43_12985 [Flavobacterium sp. HXWNR29]|uniref:hypothetical protein n=1 Tax=Flavobacterium odoriferum TaxID=2946604 RepID=UPI0021CB2E83|nr:hypothetical protein [Flavobacterium sp. HXWNR29]MCU4190070.1 hypothetical protein [Flavobacterium sp. HXWNR29]